MRSTSTSRLRWLLIIVSFEFLVVIGLVSWAILKPTKQTGVDTTTASEATSNETITSSLIATGFGAITDIQPAPANNDNHLLVVEQAGTIQVVSQNGAKADTPFLDISAKVNYDQKESGLLGLAFHPHFTQNGYFYVNYVDMSGNTVVSRFQVATSGAVDMASEKVLLTFKQPYTNHNAGGLAFGPDGFLYITTGDGGSGGDPENHAQNKGDLLGKILRVDVNGGDPYVVPTTNPFVSDISAKPEVWALGLRNPWRISFDKLTGDLYIADVGQDVIEELDFQQAGSKGGQNYGWRCYEGTAVYNNDGCSPASDYTAPAFEYKHENDRCSITGGYVYRGSRSPTLDGMYLYGDLCTGEVFAAKQQNNVWGEGPILKTPYKISTFGQDNNGEVYVADINSGSVYRIETH